MKLRQVFTVIDVPMELKCDSLGAISIAERPLTSGRSKHIDVQHHFVRERVEMGQVRFSYVTTLEQVADVLTKPLEAQKHAAAISMLGMA